MPILTMLIRIVVATFFGGLIGMEREIHGCAAGFRTHILVCMGSALFMLTSIMISVHYGHVGEADISRIAAGVVTGIGFLGAGAIIRYGVSVRGLTTAASIWAVSAIGLAVGIGMYAAAGITTAVALTVLILSHFEGLVFRKNIPEKLTVSFDAAAGTGEMDLKNVIESSGGKIQRITSNGAEGQDEKKITIYLSMSRICRSGVIATIAALPGVKDVNWE